MLFREYLQLPEETNAHPFIKNIYKNHPDTITCTSSNCNYIPLYAKYNPKLRIRDDIEMYYQSRFEKVAWSNLKYIDDDIDKKKQPAKLKMKPATMRVTTKIITTRFNLHTDMGIKVTKIPTKITSKTLNMSITIKKWSLPCHQLQNI